MIYALFIEIKRSKTAKRSDRKIKRKENEKEKKKKLNKRARTHSRAMEQGNNT